MVPSTNLYMRKITAAVVLCSIFVVNACRKTTTPAEYNAKAANAELYHQSLAKLTEVIIHDIFSPPVASRIYAYANLAGYEAMAAGDSTYESLAGKLKKFKGVPPPDPTEVYCFALASTRAFLSVARTLTFSGQYFDDYEKTLYPKYENMGIPSDVIARSMAYGDSVAAHIIKYSAKDNYKQTRGFRHTVTNEPGTWVPTPPAYADAVEPLWGTIRSMTMDSASQFLPPPPPAYTQNKNSLYFKEVMEVYNLGKNLSEEQQRMAWFWDDNAFVMNVVGHVSFANKKMTPGGHWLAIAATVCRQEKIPFNRCVEAYALTSIALLDGFINCWDTKYRFNKLRPETAINSTFDPSWKPYLQAPPFPEYTSGHSTITAAAAAVLSNLIGDVAFVDSTEFKHGHGVMSFKSFKEAADMASISRVYGGIHFRSACEAGSAAGVKVGQNVLAIAKTKK
jgi:PAP2 superfamily